MLGKLSLLICALLLIISVSCSDDDPISPVKTTVVGSGSMITVDRTVGPFSSVTVAAVATVNITIGAEQAVSITVDDNILEYITVTSSGGVLTISASGYVNLHNYELTANLTMTDLENLSITGVGNINSVTAVHVDSLGITVSGVGNISLELEADFLNTALSGVGNLLLSGSVTRHLLSHSGVGSIGAYELSTDTTTAVVSGVGNAYVYVGNFLDVTISGLGSLYYRGTPTIQQLIEGTGSVIDAN